MGSVANVHVHVKSSDYREYCVVPVSELELTRVLDMIAVKALDVTLPLRGLRLISEKLLIEDG